MYAIIKTGSKQYRVKEGDVIDVELLSSTGEDNEEHAQKGEQIEFKEVLWVRDGETAKAGAPTLSEYVVIGECLGQTKGEKIVAYKYKRRQNFHKKIGHRQKYNRVRITEIKRAA